MSASERKRLELGVFDLDGTLIELELEHFHDEVRRLFPILGAAVPERDLIHELTRNRKIFHGVHVDQRETFEAEFWRRFDRNSQPPARLIANALETLEQLVAMGLSLVVATARSEAVHLIREYLHPIGINDHLQFISSFSGESWRDKTTQLENLCKRCEITPDRAFMAGDTVGDVLSGQKAGFSLTIGVLSGEYQRADLEAAQAHVIVEHVGEIPGLLRARYEVPNLKAN